MELSKKDIEKLNSAIKVLKITLSELQEIAAKVDQPEIKSEREILKQERMDRYLYLIESGQLRRKKKE